MAMSVVLLCMIFISGNFANVVKENGDADVVEVEKRDGSDTDTTCCPDGFIAYKGSCYKFNMNKLDWDDAQAACIRDAGSHLASIKSQNEQDFLVGQIRAHYSSEAYDSFWIGMGVSRSRKQVWWDGTPVVYSNWDEGEPQCLERFGCRVFISEFLNYKWEDANDHYDFFSICQKSGGR